MDFVSVERVVELLGLEQEPLGDIDPPASWPAFTGDIIFNDVTIKYASHLEPALENISLRIRGGSHVAIVGRTGALRLFVCLPASIRITLFRLREINSRFVIDCNKYVQTMRHP